ncbi:hypothetical protein [Paenibacillus radicis (ex Xue et al. 2023)]|uniref:Uncharacterized protein n=1 Tax=Paenibacillus radicis (ex Xue et al. 2023) TaxID=2972489 RepID=A0ABT1YL55_9BACL|nr:hypothetical protein [Paenibacillus radicis (ex Xue et al. 2023)]MCR8633921.1 hypothetical protein [Paenibacillus radicis (ex Xue et al. 2023)]
MEKRMYYSTRNNKKAIDVYQLYKQLQSLFLYYKSKDYFKEKLSITSFDVPEDANHKAMFEIKFMPFPIEKWDRLDVTEENIFDTIEFLFHHVSKPGELAWYSSDTGYNYQDYENYDDFSGKVEFKGAVNLLICDYSDGFEISDSGEILSLGKNGLEEILDAEIIQYDPENVDFKVREAIRKWKNRSQSVEDRRQAIIDLANVFEWLKKTEKLAKALDKKDESLIFELANKFELRHHNPEQIRNYDKNIWHSWMFHFYLATYHAVIRILKKQEDTK